MAQKNMPQDQKSSGRSSSIENGFSAEAFRSIFQGASWPMSRQDLISKFGDRQISDSRGRRIELRQLIGKLSVDRIGSIDEFVKHVNQSMSKLS